MSPLVDLPAETREGACSAPRQELELPRPWRLMLTAGWNLAESLALPAAAYPICTASACTSTSPRTHQVHPRRGRRRDRTGAVGTDVLRQDDRLTSREPP